MNRLTISYLSFFINSLLIFGQYEKDLISPLEIPFSLSGTFGEPRATHFHLGLDIRTQGKEGLEVKSISSGRVSRIRVSLGGYGKAIYLYRSSGSDYFCLCTPSKICSKNRILYQKISIYK